MTESGQHLRGKTCATKCLRCDYSRQWNTYESDVISEKPLMINQMKSTKAITLCNHRGNQHFNHQANELPRQSSIGNRLKAISILLSIATRAWDQPRYRRFKRRSTVTEGVPWRRSWKLCEQNCGTWTNGGGKRNCV